MEEELIEENSERGTNFDGGESFGKGELEWFERRCRVLIGEQSIKRR